MLHHFLVLLQHQRHRTFIIGAKKKEIFYMDSLFIFITKFYFFILEIYHL
jgi:hypothetical protein